MPRSRVTVDGINEVFKVIGVAFREHPTLGGYEAEYKGKLFQARLLTTVAQKVLCEIAGQPWVDPKNKPEQE